MKYTKGEVIQFERTFIGDEVKEFTDLSQDLSAHHLEPDELNRYMVQGLLTATLATKIGGDLNVMARTMSFDFIRPVFTDSPIKITLTIEKYDLEEARERIAIETSFTCTNVDDKEVMKGTFTGYVFDEK